MTVRPIRSNNRRCTSAVANVSTEAFERALDRVRAAAAGQNAGIFGPASLTWRVNREAAVFLGAGRALLLQLAHPWVAAAIAEHSTAVADPIGRFHRTFHTVFTMVFGTADQALTTARGLHRRHAKISGALHATAGPFAAGSRYAANNLAALRWVHATLVETSLLTHDLVCPALTADERERYWVEARFFAGLFGLLPSDLPADWRSFAAYTERMNASGVLTVSDSGRKIAKQLFGRTATPWRLPAWYRALTAELLPQKLREEFGFFHSEQDQILAHRAITWLRRIYPLLPTGLRFVGPYHEAQQRLAGRPRPDLRTQLLNQFWIGQNRMNARDHARAASE